LSEIDCVPNQESHVMRHGFAESGSSIYGSRNLRKSNSKRRNTYNIICFSFMPWSNMWKRNQSMMAEMANYDFVNKVIFVNPDIWIPRLFVHRSEVVRTSSGVAGKFFPCKRSSKVWEYTPLRFLPLKTRFAKLKRIESQIALRVIRQLNSDMPYVLFMNCPNVYFSYLLDELVKNAGLSMFDFSDDFVELVHTKERKEFFLNNITKYAQAADIVLTVNNHLKNKYSFLNPNIHVVRNATNYYNFDRKNYNPVDFLEKIKSTKRPIIGYSGMVNASRIDFGLLDFLIEKRPDWQFVFVGLVDSTFAKRYSQYENVHHFPPVDYQKLPDHIRYFDVAIVPFKINEHTKGNNLLKFHDYLAMGKAVVSTEIGGADDIRSVISISQKPSEFLEQIEKALINNTVDDTLKRKRVALTNSWHRRVKKLVELITTYPGIGIEPRAEHIRVKNSTTIGSNHYYIRQNSAEEL
jgi:glycosyltransferase involved in cell wall biosynthesis